MKRLAIVLILFCSVSTLSAQLLIYQDIVHGGVTGNGGMVSLGGGTINFDVKIPSGSTVKKAFLLTEREYKADTITVILNGFHYTLSNYTIATNSFISINTTAPIWSNSNIHLIDITNNINPNDSIYNLTIPAQPNGIDSGIFNGFHLYIEFKNPALPLMNTALYLNTQDVSTFNHYHLIGLNPMNNSYPVGMEAMVQDYCDTDGDGSYVKVNSYNIGLMGGSDITSFSGSCQPIPSFSYYDDSLFALGDDTVDSLMLGTDATADIKSYIANFDTLLDVYFIKQGPQNYTNSQRGIILNYVSPCDTFTTHVSADTAICLGDSVQLHASGGTSSGSTPAYKWEPSYGLSCDTCANPVASPDSSVTYTVRIYHNDSCSKVLPVRVLVHKTHPQITVTPAFCGDSNGTVTFTAANAAQYFLGSQHNDSGVFGGLPSGAYPAHITDSLGCTLWQDTVQVGISNPAQAGFSLFPYSGNAPFSITTSNYSHHTNQYTWLVNGDTLHGNTITYTFDSAGNYTVTLIACHNSQPCCDTLTQHVKVDSSLLKDTASAFVPNVFTPNGDGINDVFTVNLKNIQSGEWAIYNRWGTQIVHTYLQNADKNGNLTLNWSGKTAKNKACSAGTYYYVVTYVTSEGKTKTVKGYVTLLR